MKESEGLQDNLIIKNAINRIQKMQKLD
jgi:hypothetical protein